MDKKSQEKVAIDTLREIGQTKNNNKKEIFK